MHTIDFDLDREHVELNQLLKLVGIADSGGQGKAIVASGEVTVDGAVELLPPSVESVDVSTAEPVELESSSAAFACLI